MGAGHDPASRMVQRLAHRPVRWVRESRCESVIALSHASAEGGSEADSSRSYEATAVPYESSGCEPSGTARETQGPRASGVRVPRGDGTRARDDAEAHDEGTGDGADEEDDEGDLGEGTPVKDVSIERHLHTEHRLNID